MRLKEESTITSPENAVKEVKDGSTLFRNVSFSYKKDSEKPALSDIDITINSGEVVGIIGGTGSAKSTLVQLIPRLYDVNEGEIIVGGRNVKEYKLSCLRGKIGIVPQRAVLFRGTVRDNIKKGKLVV